MFRVTYFENPIAGFHRRSAAVFANKQDAAVGLTVLDQLGHAESEIVVKQFPDKLPMYHLRIYDWNGGDHIFEWLTRNEVRREVRDRVKGWRKSRGFDPDERGMMKILGEFFQKDADGREWESMFPEDVENQFSLHRANPTKKYVPTNT